jgi:hypothetical protein
VIAVEAYKVNRAPTTTAYPNTPGQHAELLHPLKAQGQVFVGRKHKLPPPKDWEQHAYAPWELDAVLDGLAGQQDVYLTQNRFAGRRMVLQQHVRQLVAFYADVDYYDMPGLAGCSPEAVYEMALERLREAGVPEPSLAFCSGQGLYLVWLHVPVGWKELPKWQDCQEKLWRLLKPMGADSNARDAARVLRVVGTTNSKNGVSVYALREAGSRRSFEELAASILPADVGEDEERRGEGKPAELYDLRMQRASRREYRAPKRFTDRSLWLARWVDLQTWRRLRYGEDEMGDFRDRWLFLAGVAMSWITDPPEPEFFERELIGLAEEAGGWGDARTRSKMQAVLERVRMAARGETVTWEGFEWDPRYAFKTETILSWLEMTLAEEREMYTLIGGDEKRRRNTESKRRKRRAEGVKPRGDYEQERVADIRKKRASAHRLKNTCKLSNEEIAKVMRVSERTVRRLLA